jgi:hypothetical protein
MNREVHSHADHANLRLIHLRCEGLLTLDDFIEQGSQTKQDPQFQKGMHSIADLREAKLSANFAKALKFLDFMESIQESRGSCKWAVVAPRNAEYGLGMMLASISSEVSMEVRVFRKMEEAVTWVTE